MVVMATAVVVVVAEEVAGGEDRIMWVVAAPAAAHAMLVAVITAVGLDVSAGHLNPAVTIGFAAGGYVTVVRCVLYVIAQLLGSSMACLLLKYVAAGLVSSSTLPLSLPLLHSSFLGNQLARIESDRCYISPFLVTKDALLAYVIASFEA